MKALNPKTYGPTTEAFKALVADTLRKEEEPMRKRKWTIVLAAALVLTLLVATAVAAAIGVFGRKTAVEMAYAALEKEYGWTRDLTEEFREEASSATDASGGTVWTIKLIPNSLYVDSGEYEAVVTPDGVRSLTWSLDGADKALLDSGDFKSPAWGPAQLRRLNEINAKMQERMQAKETELGPFERWSMEEKAAHSQFIQDLGHPKPDMFVWVLPEEGEMTREEALEHALGLIEDKYGVTRETMDRFDWTEDYMTVATKNEQWAEWDEKQWSFEFLPKKGEDAEALGEYRVRFFVPSLDIDLCLWYSDHFFDAAPDLLEKGKLDAVHERIDTIYFDELTPAEKAAYSAPIREAGYALRRNDYHYIAPAEGDLLEQQAVDIASAALRDEGFSEKTAARFTIARSLILSDDGERLWQIIFKPSEQPVEVGARMVYITQDGAVKSYEDVDFNMYEKRPEPTASDEPLLEKRHWTAAEANTYFEIYDQAEKIRETHLNASGRMTLEGYALHDQLWRDAGARYGYAHVMPGDNDLPLDEAEEIARKAIRDTYGAAKAEPLQEPEFAAVYEEDPETGEMVEVSRHWRIVLHGPAANGESFWRYEVSVDAATGNVRRIYRDPEQANG